MERQHPAASGTKTARQNAGSHGMLRAGAKAAEKSRGEELMKARGETAGHDRKPEHTVSDTENHSSSDVRNDKAVQTLKGAAQGIINGRQRGQRHIPHPHLFHHERGDHADDRRLKMVDEVSAANDAEYGRAT